ncbi:hypothetical protein [Leucothrix arctica]|uniref:Uncharacterized protein n=1 Tax=Leucothrix arctica TaxID=1481894 RepID=A0A317C4L2_9GAMM|nr:hypothetical protein [Leucothrix arctica]PWQ93585.1 hypothetical protein DKT75_18370 [Leucothrix arctica]
MSDLIGSDGLFILSGQPSDIHDYKCFDDESKSKLIFCDELKNNPEWGEREREKWYFFYRPYKRGSKLGSYQRDMIKLKEPKINFLQEEVNSFNFLKKLFFVLVIPTLILSLYAQLWAAFVLPLLIGIFFNAKEQGVSENLRSEVLEKETYQSEIDHLYYEQENILNNRISSDDILDMFWYDMRALEGKILEEHFNDEAERLDEIEEVDEFYPCVDSKLKPSKRIMDSSPFYPVIPSWGFLQSTSRSLDDTTQATGLRAAGNEIGSNIATFRKLKDGTPFYRLWYIQNLFFREENINIISYCYDFITGKSYNQSVDTFQYNHISNSSYSNDDLSFMADGLLASSFCVEEKLTKNIYGCEVKVISFSSTSGRCCRCVLPNKGVVDGLELWSMHKNTTLYSTHDESPDIAYVKAANNDLINALANQAIKVLRKKCNKAIPLTETGLRNGQSKANKVI